MGITLFHLNCSQAEGEPEPRVTWTRQGSDLPDGSPSFSGDQLIFSHVTRDHAGTYVCTGSTPEGRMAMDTVDVLVNCEYPANTVVIM